MKPLFPLLALLLSGSFRVPLHAQNAAPAKPLAPEKSGHELLVEAGNAILPGPNGGADNTDPGIPPEENLKRERLAVARNAPALALVRQALPRPLEAAPPPTGLSDLEGFNFNARMRELARQLSQEADVRLADGDFVGAMNSKLDTMELGAALARGSLMGALVGHAVEGIGRSGVDKVAAHLDAKACRVAAARLETIEGRRAPLQQVLRDEQHFATDSGLKSLAAINAQVHPLAEEDGGFPTQQDLAQLKALTTEQLTQDNARFFDALVQNAAQPYSNAAPVLPEDVNPMTRLSLMWAKDGTYRFNFARTVVQNRLLRSALLLRAQKLELGSYPTQFSTPLDPFSPDGQPLVYHKTKAGYLLYSVGPDGKDDGGEDLQALDTLQPSGIKVVTDKLRPQSLGDVVQRPF